MLDIWCQVPARLAKHLAFDQADSEGIAYRQPEYPVRPESVSDDHGGYVGRMQIRK